MVKVKFKGASGEVVECDKPFESRFSAELFIETVRSFTNFEPWIEEVKE